MFSVVTCVSTLIVYCDINSGYANKQLSCTKPLPRGILNVICGICVAKLFFHQYIVFQLAQLIYP